jgi:Flp pilus assembly protein TadD
MAGLLMLALPASAEEPAKKKASAASSKKKAQVPSKSEQAKGLYQDATELIRQKQFENAELMAQRCSEADPRFAECHLVHGAALAYMGQPDKAADAYRSFLRLAPDHPQSPKVKQVLENYEKSKLP